MERLEQIALDCIYRAVECDRKGLHTTTTTTVFLKISSLQFTRKERERKREILPPTLSLSLTHTSGTLG